MRDNLSFLVIGDSAAGKSAFIRNFADPDTAKLLNISGEGQTTRSSYEYKFSTEGANENRVEIRFYSMNEFVDRSIEKILQRSEIIISEGKSDLNIELKPNEHNICGNDYYFTTEDMGKIRNMCDKDLITDEFMNIREVGLLEKDGYLLSTFDLQTIENMSDFKNVLKDKLQALYKKMSQNIFEINIKFEIIEQRDNESTVNDIKPLKFILDSSTSILLTLCVKNLTLFERRKNGINNIASISGLVKTASISLNLHPTYAALCEKVGIHYLNFVDTYGLNHAGNIAGDISIKNIKERLESVFNDEFRDIEFVIFVTPMIGNSASTNNKFKALIEAKRSVMPQIIYTKYDKYAKKQLCKDISSMSKQELKDVIDNFNNENINEIKADFSSILREYYSNDVAEYRMQCIFENITYFMGAYEEDSDANTAQKNNAIYFKNILMSIFKNDNYGIEINSIEENAFEGHLRDLLYSNRERIETKLRTMLVKSQEKLKNNYSLAHSNTQTAFWKRIQSNMFGFPPNLNLRNILLGCFNEFIAKDTGIYKDNNMGNYCVDDYFVKRKLNVFIRECINKFADYYICPGCCPCDKLKPGQCEMSPACNTTGRAQRLHRKDNCHQLYKGGLNCLQQSRYCVNYIMYGIGLFENTYGTDNGCSDGCIWKDFFDYYQEKSELSLNFEINVEVFIKHFLTFCTDKLNTAKENLCDLHYLYDFDNNPDDYINSPYKETEKFKEILSSKKKYVLLTEGKTDKIHIEVAWSKRKETDMPFDICSMDSANNMLQFLRSYPMDLFRDIVFIGILDCDNTGIKIFNKISDNSNVNPANIKKADKNYYVLKLQHDDKKLEQYEALEIELLYSKDILENYSMIQKRSISEINGLEYVKKHNIFLRPNEYDECVELHFYQPKDNKKVEFSNKILEEKEYLDKECFQGFDNLFMQIYNIIN